MARQGVLKDDNGEDFYPIAAFGKIDNKLLQSGISQIVYNPNNTAAAWTSFTFDTPFDNPPVVVATPSHNTGGVTSIQVGNITSTGFSVLAYTMGTQFTNNFTWIAYDKNKIVNLPSGQIDNSKRYSSFAGQNSVAYTTQGVSIAASPGLDIVTDAGAIYRVLAQIAYITDDRNTEPHETTFSIFKNSIVGENRIAFSTMQGAGSSGFAVQGTFVGTGEVIKLIPGVMHTNSNSNTIGWREGSIFVERIA